MDIFQRTCCKAGKILPKDDEVEIYEAETAEGEEEEVEEDYLKSEEPINLQDIYNELDCMKRRIQFLQIHLKTKIAECPEEECVDPEILLTCSENKDICTLQKNQHKLQCQINELIKCCHVAKDEIRDLRLRLCDKSRDILELQKIVASLITWRNTLEHEFGKCIERFEYLKHVKAEWQDVEDKLNKQRRCFTQMTDTFVSKVCLTKEKQFFVDAVNEMKDMLKEMVDFQLNRVSILQKLVGDTTLSINAYDTNFDSTLDTTLDTTFGNTFNSTFDNSQDQTASNIDVKKEN